MLTKETFVKLLKAMKEEDAEINKMVDNYVIPYKTVIGEHPCVNMDYFPLVQTLYDSLGEILNCKEEDAIFTWYLWEDHSRRSYKEFIDMYYDGDVIVEGNPVLETAEQIYDYLHAKYMRDK